MGCQKGCPEMVNPPWTVFESKGGASDAERVESSAVPERREHLQYVARIPNKNGLHNSVFIVELYPLTGTTHERTATLTECVFL